MFQLTFQYYERTFYIGDLHTIWVVLLQVTKFHNLIHSKLNRIAHLNEIKNIHRNISLLHQIYSFDRCDGDSETYLVKLAFGFNNALKA